MACQSSTYHHVQHHGCQREIHANWPGQHHGFRAVIVPGRRCSDDRSSAAAAVEGVGVEGGEEDEYDGGDEGEDDGAADMAAELAVGVADLVPPGVRVALEPYPRHAAARAHRRGHHRRVELPCKNAQKQELNTFRHGRSPACSSMLMLTLRRNFKDGPSDLGFATYTPPSRGVCSISC